MSRRLPKVRLTGFLGTLAVACVVSGCGGGASGMGGSLPMGESCSSVRAKLNRLDAKGVPSLIEAQSRGQKLGGQQKADADAYNGLLNQYLGARCHEAPKA